jgi:hypothetical protein
MTSRRRSGHAEEQPLELAGPVQMLWMGGTECPVAMLKGIVMLNFESNPKPQEMRSWGGECAYVAGFECHSRGVAHLTSRPGTQCL